MVIDLDSHGLGVGRRARGVVHGNAFEDITKAVFQRVTTDPDIKAQTASKAVELATGLPPRIVREDGVTWVRLLPQHGEFVDAIFLKGVKKITAGPSKGQVADFKVDVMPAIKPLLWRRVFPVMAVLFVASAGVGYYLGKR